MYRKGRSGERYVVEKFWKAGFAAVRTPGSGRAYRRPHPDLIAGNGKKYFGVEVKVVNSDAKYFSQREVDDLVEFCKIFGGESIIAVRFVSRWRFFSISDLEKTEKGYKAIVTKGKNFEEILGVL